jgi:hypothetical protein
LIVLAFGIFPSNQAQISKTIQDIPYNQCLFASFFAFHTAFLVIPTSGKVISSGGKIISMGGNVISSDGKVVSRVKNGVK